MSNTLKTSPQQPEKESQEQHLGSKFEDILFYEKRLHQLEENAEKTSIEPAIFNQEIQREIDLEKKCIKPSNLSRQKLYERVGLIIHYNPIFVQKLIQLYYAHLLPQKFNTEMQSLKVSSMLFHATWWVSFVSTAAFFIKKRYFQDKSHTSKVVLSLAGFLGVEQIFNDAYYIPELQKTFFRNIRTVDKIIDIHIDVLQKTQQMQKGQGNRPLQDKQKNAEI